MPYCTLADLTAQIAEEVLIGLTDRTNSPPTTIDETPVDQAINAADALIDSYAGARYVVPFVPVPEIVTQVSATLAINKLFDYGDQTSEPWEKKAAGVKAWLKDVAKNIATITDGATPPDPASSSGGEASSQPRVFDRDKLKDF